MSEMTVADALSQLRSIREFHGADLSVTTMAVMDALEALAREKADAVPSPAQAAERLGRELVERYGGEVVTVPPKVETGRCDKCADAYHGLCRGTGCACSTCLEQTRIGSHQEYKRLGDERDAALRRAEAAEKELDEAKTAKIFLAAKLDDTHTHRCWHCQNTVTEATSKRQMSERDALLKERDTLRARVMELKAENAAVRAKSLLQRQERDALRADCEGLSKQHEQDKAELATAKEHLAGMHKVAEQDRATAQTATADLDELRRERNRAEVRNDRWREAAAQLRQKWSRGHDEHTGTDHVVGCFCLHCMVARDVAAALDAAEKP